MTKKRFIMGLAIGLIGFLIAPISGSTAPATTYGFEECAEGWVVTESRQHEADTAGEWKPSSPGNPDGSPVQAFRTQPYPVAAQAGDPTAESYQAWLTSPTHTFAAPGKIAYTIKHDLETVPESPLPIEGGDFIYVMLSTNGGSTYTKVDTISGLSPVFAAKEVTVPKAGQVKLQFHLYSDNNTSGQTGSAGEVAIDDVVFPTPRPSSATCEGGEEPPPTTKPCTKSGNGGNNTLQGTAKADKLCGKGGKDTLYGKGGKDVLVGGPGNDKCYGGPGRDTFKGCETKKQ